MNNNNRWIIKDWSGAIKFAGKSFPTFQDARDYLSSHTEDTDEYFIAMRGNK